MEKKLLRQGRFRKKLVGLEELEKEAPFIEKEMTSFVQEFNERKMSAPELCGIYILIVLNYRRPFHLLGQKISTLTTNHCLNFPCHRLPLNPQILSKVAHLSIGDIFNQFSLRSTPISVNRALLQWSKNNYHLELMFKIPGPLEVLDQQVHAKRCVSLLYKSHFSKKYILGERDALSFLMHDLIHADHFFHHNECFEGQISFYGLIQKEKDFFSDLLNNPKFHDEFEYLISDMNAYAIHAFKCLKSAIIHYGSHDLFNTWIDKFDVKEELSILNTQDYVPEIHDQKILKWLKEFQVSRV
jgi:hypothetical protein